MMRFYDVEDAIEDIRRSKTLARAFDTENSREYIKHLDNLEAAYLKELQKRKMPAGPVNRKHDKKDWRMKNYGKFI